MRLLGARKLLAMVSMSGPSGDAAGKSNSRGFPPERCRNERVSAHHGVDRSDRLHVVDSGVIGHLVLPLNNIGMRRFSGKGYETNEIESCRHGNGLSRFAVIAGDGGLHHGSSLYMRDRGNDQRCDINQRGLGVECGRTG